MKFFFLFFLPISLTAFVVNPWFPKIAEFKFRPDYSYRYYPSINNGFNPSKYHSNDQLIDTNLGVRFLPNWEAQIEIDFANTRCLSWGTQRIGSQIRYLILDDIAGDSISLVLGGQAFYVPRRNMRDVSSPYHSVGNMEFNIAIGKEFSQIDRWLYRYYGFFGLGMGNKGYPWIRPVLSFEWKHNYNKKIQLFIQAIQSIKCIRRLSFMKL